jgi:hypothetical protein
VACTDESRRLERAGEASRPERRLASGSYLAAFYIAGGLAATMTQTAVTLLFSTAAAGGSVPTLSASGVAFFAHIGCFAFGALVTRTLLKTPGGSCLRARRDTPPSRAVGAVLSAVTVLSVAVVGVLFGGLAVILAVPFTSAVTTLIDVFVLGHEPPTEQPRRSLRLRRSG